VSQTLHAATPDLANIELTILDSNEKPIENAEVVLHQWMGKKYGDSVGTGTTDVSGKALLPNVPAEVYSNIVVKAPGYAPSTQSVELIPGESRKLTHHLFPPVDAIVRFEDESGTPVAGVMTGDIEFKQRTGESVYARFGEEETLSWKIAPSDSSGIMLIQNVPSGSQMSLKAIHPNFLPPKNIEGIAADGLIATAKLQRGGTRLDLQIVDYAGNPFLDHSRPIEALYSPREGRAGFVRFKFQPVDGRYSFHLPSQVFDQLSFTCEGFVVSPHLARLDDSEKHLIDFSDGTEHALTIILRPKLKAKGRVLFREPPSSGRFEITSTTSNLRVVDSRDSKVSLSQLRSESVGNAETDKDGYFEIDVVEGVNRVFVSEDGYYSIPFERSLEVSSTSINTIDDIQVERIPIFRGKVHDESGKSLAKAIVRTQTKLWFSHEQTVTDENGDFELKIRFLPYDHENETQVQAFGLIAFDPRSLQAGSIDIDLSHGASDVFQSLTIQTSERPIEWASEQNGRNEGQLALYADRAAADREEFKAGAIGGSVPELGNGTWLNTTATSLADFHGKFVLLDFWFVGCGPCEREFPFLKSLQDIYGEDNFTIVSIHSGDQGVDSVRQYCEKRKMDFPIFVDGPTEEIRKLFKPFGLISFPHYILLDPDGKIVFNDALQEKNSLREEKFEIIREHLWRAGNLR
jgi:thiol-disulfide isomerase/thioredoxin